VWGYPGKKKKKLAWLQLSFMIQVVNQVIKQIDWLDSE
jgi:hypothetical protein